MLGLVQKVACWERRNELQLVNSFEGLTEGVSDGLTCFMTKSLAVFKLNAWSLRKFSNSATCYFDGYLIRSVTVAHFTQVKDQQEAEKRKVTSQEIQESLQVPFLHPVHNNW